MKETKQTQNNAEFTPAMISQLDLIDNTAYETCCTFLGIGPEDRETQFPWNMEIIGHVVGAITSILNTHGYHFCYPYSYEDADGSMKLCELPDCLCSKCVREGEHEG